MTCCTTHKRLRDISRV